MAIEFRSAITIGGVNVVPGYPALSGLTAGQVLRASGSGTVAFVALVAADLPATAVTAAAYGSATQVPTFTVDAAGRLTLAANVAIAIAASAITSGQLNLVHGGTGVDLSATGGANQIVRQNSSGGVFTVSVLATADIPTQLNAFGVRAALGSNAAGVYVPWITADALPTVFIGSNSTSNDQIALQATSYSGNTLTVQSTNGLAIQAIRAGTVTNSVVTGMNFTHRSSGVIANGFGLALRFQLQSSTTADQDAARIVTLWTDYQHVSRTAALTFWTVNNAVALAEQMRLTGIGQLLLRSTDATQANGGYFPWITGDTLPAMVVGAGGTHSTGGITVRSGTGLSLYAVSTTGTPLFGERLSSTATNSIASLLVIKHTAATPASVVAGYGVGLAFQLSSTTTSGRSAAQIAAVWSDPADATFTADLVFQTALSAAAVAERMRITGAGNVGIATSAPTALLDVLNGTIRARDGANVPPTASSGVEILMTSAVGYLQSYSRTGAAWLPLNLNASTITVGGSTTVTFGIGATSPGAPLYVVNGTKEGFRMASAASRGSSFMSYGTGAGDALYLGANLYYDGTNWRAIENQVSWLVMFGAAGADYFNIYRNVAPGAANGTVGNTSMFLVDNNGYGYFKGNVRGSASPSGMVIGVHPSYAASFSALWRWDGNASSNNDYLLLTDNTNSYFNCNSATGILYFRHANTKGSYLDGSGNFVSYGVLAPGNQISYYLNYTASPAGLIVYGNLSSYHDIYPGNNNGTGAAQNASYYLRGETNSAGIRTNGNMLATGAMYADSFNASGGGGTNHFAATVSGGLGIYMYTYEPGISATNGIFGYNYAAGARVNGSWGGGFLRLSGDGSGALISMDTGGTQRYIFEWGTNNIGVGVAHGSANRLFSKGVDSTSSNNAFICQNSNGSNLMYVRNDGLVWANQAWTISDARRKERIRALPYGLKDILQLRATMFDMIGGAKDQLGFIAQEVQLVVPEIVMEEAFNPDSVLDPMLALNPASIIPILVRSTQELAAMVAALQQEIAALRGPKPCGRAAKEQKQ